MEHTTPPPNTLDIQRFASTGSQESGAHMNSKTAVESSDFQAAAGSHDRQPRSAPVNSKTAIESSDFQAQATKNAARHATPWHAGTKVVVGGRVVESVGGGAAAGA